MAYNVFDSVLAASDDCALSQPRAGVPALGDVQIRQDSRCADRAGHGGADKRGGRAHPLAAAAAAAAFARGVDDKGTRVYVTVLC